MDHLHIRCPSCAKLYQVEVGRIFSSSPEFQCQSCKTHFSFDFPPLDPLSIETKRIGAQEPGFSVKKCARCGAENPSNLKECRSCGVIFEKIEGWPAGSGVKAQPSLLRRWKSILDDYSHRGLHEDFIEACRGMDALEFAKSQYREIKKLQGNDPIADQMLAEISRLKMSSSSLHSKDSKRAQTIEKSAKSLDDEVKSWWRFTAFIPYLVGLIFVFWGLSWGGHRHMIGAGMAILIVAFVLVPDAKRIFLELFRFRKNVLK